MSKAFSFISAFALVCVLLVLPASAATGDIPASNTPVFIDLPCTVSYETNWGGTYKTCSGTFTTSDNCKFTCIGNTFYVFTDDVNAIYVYNYVEPNAGTGSANRSFSSSNSCTYGDTVLYYKSEAIVGYFFSNQSIDRVYPDDLVNYSGSIGANAQEIVEAWLSSSAGPDVPDKSYVDIPAGYVAVLYVKNPSQWSAGSLRCSFPFSSFPNAPYWGNTGQSYKFFDSRPAFSEQTLFPLPNMSSIGWSKGGSFGVGGQTNYAIGEISFGPSYNWCVIYNPFVTFDSDANNPKYNGAIRVHAGVAEAYLYPVAQLLGSDGWESRSLNDWENPYVGAAPEDDNGYWSWTEPATDPEDPPTIVIPPEGGSNEAPVEVTSQGLLSQIIGILGNLLSEIAGLFSFAFEAITNLVSLAGGFFAVLGGIFGWLPEQVVSLIVSSLALIVTVGVLRSFL